MEIKTPKFEYPYSAIVAKFNNIARIKMLVFECNELRKEFGLKYIGGDNMLIASLITYKNYLKRKIAYRERKRLGCVSNVK